MKKLLPFLAALCAVLAAAIVVTVVLRGQAPLAPETTAASSDVTASDEEDAAPAARPAKTTAPEADTTTAPTEPPTSAAEDSDAWQSAYRAYLSDYESDGMRTPKFALIYLDADDVPELAVCNGSYHAARWTVLTYRDGVKEIGEFGGWGDLTYYEKAATVFSSYGNQGSWTANIYRIENGEAVSVWEGNGDLDEDGNELYFDADGNPIPETEYNAQIDAAVPAGAQERVLSFDDDGWEITADQIEAHVK